MPGDLIIIPTLQLGARSWFHKPNKQIGSHLTSDVYMVTSHSNDTDVPQRDTAVVLLGSYSSAQLQWACTAKWAPSDFLLEVISSSSFLPVMTHCSYSQQWPGAWRQEKRFLQWWAHLLPRQPCHPFSSDWGWLVQGCCGDQPVAAISVAQSLCDGKGCWGILASTW